MLGELPVELQEKIVSYLDGYDLVSACRVCRLWRQLAEARCRREVLETVPDDVLEELRAELATADADEEADPDEDRWPELLRRWLQSQLLRHTPWRVVYTHQFPSTVLALLADGRRLYAADSKGMLTVLEAAEPESIERLYLHDVHITQLLAMWQLGLLVVTGADTHFIRQGRRPQLLMCAENMTGRRRVSIHRDKLATMRDIYQRTSITVYRVTHDDRWARLQTLYEVSCAEPAFQWSLWRDKLICFLRNGQLCVWDQTTHSWSAHPDLYSEIRYENPAWVVRDTVLCSTLMQRQLMGYWHMDREMTYWLHGRVDQPLVRVQPAVNETILCLCARRSLLVAGTQSGKVLFFHSGSRRGAVGEWPVPPPAASDRTHSDVNLTSLVCTIELGFNAVERVSVGFCDSAVLVYVKTRKSMVEFIEVSEALLKRPQKEETGGCQAHVRTRWPDDGTQTAGR